MLCFCHFIFAAAKITFLIPHKEHLKIKNLSLVHFKNHLDFQITIDKDIVAISGLNGVGKTSVLDAIHFLCVGKSYFSGTDVQCINTEQPVGGILATLFTEEDIDLKVKFKRGSRKRIERNGALYKVLDHIGHFFAVVIAPGDIELIYGSNEVRRTFVDQILSQTNHEYLIQLVKYKKLLEHRNKHLKQDEIDHALLETLDDQMSPLAQYIYAERKEFLQQFSLVFQNKYAELSGEKETIELSYISQLEHNSYRELTAMNRNKDIAVQRSFSGIHKDELDIEIEKLNLRKFGSQGQIKSGLIALKLAEYEYIASSKKVLPFLLLDDIFEKIDEERALVLTQIIKNGNFGQIFITDTNKLRLENFCNEIGTSHQSITLA